MQVKNNYKECITNLACSIRKYFDLSYTHNTLEYIDTLLEEKKPNNVVVILFDGMGSRILDRNLDKDSFFRRHKLKEITTIFPATTTAATVSIRTGLNPVEHGWLGWNMYIAPIDKTITLFKDTLKGSYKVSKEFVSIKDKLVSKTIVDEINEKGEYHARELFPFGPGKYKNLDDMLNIIKTETETPGKKYIFAYDDQPDYSMHDLGPDAEEVVNLIKIRNDRVEELCKNLKDTLVIVIADHGHLKCDHIYLKDNPALKDLLARTTSLEQRATSFKVKERKKEEFIEEFNKSLGNYFTLYSKEEIIASKLFGEGEQNELFESALEDFIAIAESSNKCLIDDGDEVLFSHHAGYTDDEIYIPLIVVDRK